MAKKNDSKSNNLIDEEVDGSLFNLDPFLSPDRVAQFLDVSRAFVYARIESGELKSKWVGSKLRRVRVSWVLEWIKEQSKESFYGKKEK